MRPDVLRWIKCKVDRKSHRAWSPACAGLPALRAATGTQQGSGLTSQGSGLRQRALSAAAALLQHGDEATLISGSAVALMQRKGRRHLQRTRSPHGYPLQNRQGCRRDCGGDQGHEGGFLLDFLNFRRVTHVVGWHFEGLLAVRDGTVLFRSYAGEPRTDRPEREVNPLGPLQPAGDSPGSIVTR